MKTPMRVEEAREIRQVRRGWVNSLYLLLLIIAIWWTIASYLLIAYRCFPRSLILAITAHSRRYAQVPAIINQLQDNNPQNDDPGHFMSTLPRMRLLPCCAVATSCVKSHTVGTTDIYVCGRNPPYNAQQSRFHTL